MKLVYISAGLGMHIYALTDEYYNLLGDDFTFISVVKPSGDGGIHKHGEIGKSYERPYVLNAWESEEKQSLAKSITNAADVVIGGGVFFTVHS